MANLEALSEQAATEIKTALEEVYRLDEELDAAVGDEEDSASEENQAESDRLVAETRAANEAYEAVLVKWGLESNDPRVAAL